MPITDDTRRRLPRMEGLMARWYARQRGTASQLAAWRAQAADLTAGLADGARILEVAPGPGYLAVELARSGRFRVTGLDLSRTFVELASGYASGQRVEVDFREGDVEAMPLPSDTFDLLVCQAAFKNFGRPVVALDEMHRVLRPGGVAVIHDMSREATPADVRAEVAGMHLPAVNAFMVRRTLGALRLRAASMEHWRDLVSRSAFGGAQLSRAGIGTEVRMVKAGAGDAGHTPPTVPG